MKNKFTFWHFNCGLLYFVTVYNGMTPLNSYETNRFLKTNLKKHSTN